MVMDAQPSPQSVGREFVRQYYTLLNKAPNHLHRFYNNHSSFIHGGLDSHNREAIPVIGQKNIYNKIQQLNFRDCHAKISQVDAQATLGNGVVVQVTGELSNDGQPMRRFTQTFVLAAQSPKNYYVHNDIFRYQDLYSDEENEAENRSENDEEQEGETKIIDGNQQNTIGQPQQLYYPIPAAAVAAHPAAVGQTVAIPPFTTQPPQVNGVVHDELLQVIQPPAQPVQIAPQAVVATQPPQQQASVHQTQVVTTISTGTISTPVSAAISVSAATVTPLPIDSVNKDINVVNMQKSVVHNQSPDIATMNDSAIKSENEIAKKDEYKTMLENTEKQEALKMPQNEPKTYANLFKSITSAGNSGFVSLPSTAHQNILGQSPAKPQELRSDTAPTTALPQRTNSTRQIKEFSERRVSNTNAQYSDSHQLFFGNVPHHATEEELKILFSKFGPVVDLRLHSKAVSKVPGVRLSPNYGFVTYEDPESVQNCLSNCPLYFPDNSPDGQKLNVEEKKVRQRNNANDLNRLSNNMTGSSGMGSSQRTAGGTNRSLSNSGGMMRGGTGGSGGPPRGTTGGPRPTGSFSRSERGAGGPSARGPGNGTPNTGGGNSYGRR